jgi:hypothetical protein
MKKHRRRRLNKIADAKEWLEESLLELRKPFPQRASSGVSNATFEKLYYLVSLAKKAP